MPWNERKQQQALNCNLLKELKVHDASYRRYLRMDPSHFKALSELVAPIITRRKTNFHDSISVGRNCSELAKYVQNQFSSVRFSSVQLQAIADR